MKFTDRAMKSLKACEKRYLLWEDSSHGLGTLGVRVSTTGRRSWVFAYYFDDVKRMLTLGRYPVMSVAEVHRIAAEYQELMDAGKDPAPKLEAPDPGDDEGTVNAIAEAYLELGLRAGRTRDEFRRILEREVLPSWGSRPAQSIQRREVVRLIDAITARPAPVAANRTLAVIKAMFNFAIRRGQVEATPASLIPMNEESARERFLSEAELKVLLEELPSAPVEAGTKLALLLTLATGQRPGEVVGAEWDELRERDGWWTIPPTKRKVGRRGRGRRRPLTRHGVPLTPAGQLVVDAVRDLAWSERWLFGSSRTDQHIREDALTKGVRRSEENLGLEHWTPHDLRRTASTHMARLGVSRLVIGKILGHKATADSVTAIYDQYTYDEEKVAALGEWSGLLVELGLEEAVTRVRRSAAPKS